MEKGIIPVSNADDQEKWRLKLGYWFNSMESIRDLDKVVFKESCEPNPDR